jgi:hypothetical protein
MASVTDAFLVYSFMKRLVLPFHQWPAYKLGIIDEHGKVLKPKRTLRSQEEHSAWGRFDIIIANLKKLIAKVPGGSSMIGSAAAAGFLFKECKDIDAEDKQLLQERFDHYFSQLLTEEVPTNAVAGGRVAGLGVGPQGEPPKHKATLRQLKKILKRKEIN